MVSPNSCRVGHTRAMHTDTYVRMHTDEPPMKRISPSFTIENPDNDNDSDDDDDDDDHEEGEGSRRGTREEARRSRSAWGLQSRRGRAPIKRPTEGDLSRTRADESRARSRRTSRRRGLLKRSYREPLLGEKSACARAAPRSRMPVGLRAVVGPGVVIVALLR